MGYKKGNQSDKEGNDSVRGAEEKDGREGYESSEFKGDMEMTNEGNNTDESFCFEGFEGSDSSGELEGGEDLVDELRSDESDSLSDYQSDDHCELNNSSDSDFEDAENDSHFYSRDRQLNQKEGERIEFKVGDVFVDVYALRSALRTYAVQEGFELLRVKNEKVRVTMKCTAKRCTWMLHASQLSDKKTFCVKTYNEGHTCVRVDSIKEATTRWMGTKLVTLLRDNPSINNTALVQELKGKYGIDPPYMKLYRARKHALEIVEGGHSEAFARMPQYAEIVSSTNPGSLVKIQFESDDCDEEKSSISVPQTPHFRRFFLGLDGLKRGFLEGCNPFIGFDGCHLKGPYGGVLLSAIGLDGNNGLYPLAFAVVETECKDSWGFFFENLICLLGGFEDDKPWTFMTDRQKGLVEAINELVPTAMNRKCARHIYANFRLKHPGPKLKKYFWMAARAYCPTDFNFAMFKVKEESELAYKYLIDIPAEMWSRHAFDMRLKNDHITNNLSESFNNWVGELRCKSVLGLLDGIRAKMMGRIQKRAEKGMKWSNKLVDKVVGKLNNLREEAKRCTIHVTGQTEFEVQDNGRHYIVDIRKRSYDCGVWNLTGIPCLHAIIGLEYKRMRLEDNIDDCYTTQVYLKAYSYPIYAIKHPSFWPPATCNPSTTLPPHVKRLPGRPKKRRNREADENRPMKRSGMHRCKKCNVLGHNAQTCGRGNLPRSSKRMKAKVLT